MDDLMKEYERIHKGNDLEKLHKTKTFTIILKDISPAILKEIIKDIEEKSPFQFNIII